MGVAQGIRIQREDIPQFLFTEVLLVRYLPIHNRARQPLLANLSLEYLLLHRSGAEKAINPACLLLPISPYTSHRLTVIGRIPIGIKQDQSIRSDQVQAHASCLGGQ